VFYFQEGRKRKGEIVEKVRTPI